MEGDEQITTTGKDRFRGITRQGKMNGDNQAVRPNQPGCSWKRKRRGRGKKKMRKRKRCDLIASREKRAENPSPTTSTDGNACA